MFKQVFKKFLNSFISVLPIALIVLVLFLFEKYTDFFSQTIISQELLIIFLISSFCLVIGMTLFSIGADTALEASGKYLGSSFAKQKSLFMVVILILLLGILIVIAEPDVSALATYVPDTILDTNIIKLVIAIGAGIFFVLGFIRIMFQKSLKLWYMFFFLIIFGLATILGDENGPIIDLSFDSGAVTTGPITVPFFIAFGVGIAGTRGGKDSTSDSFGIAAMCSIGPIITMMILGLIIKPVIQTQVISTEITGEHLLSCFLSALSGIAIALLPIILFFLIYNFLVLKLPKNEILKILFGYLLTFVGLVIFLTAANFGFIPVGNALGKGLAYNESYYPILFAITILFGALIVFVEPGVTILATQVEEVSNGVIGKKKMFLTILFGVSVAIFLSVVRVIYTPTLSVVYFLVPIYIVIFLLALIVPDIFTAIAFDAGEVASGLVASNFVLPFILGISTALDNSSSGFGVIGMITAMPMLAVEVMGLYAESKTYLVYRKALRKSLSADDLQVIHFNNVEVKNEKG